MIRFWDPSREYKEHKAEFDGVMQRVLSEGELILRDEVEKFEKSFAKYIGTKYCVSVGNGTDAIQLALEALGVLGKPVATSWYTFIATHQAIERSGNYTIPHEASEEFVLEAKEFSEPVIVPVHIAGHPVDMKKLRKLNKKSVIVEDACQGIGADGVGKHSNASCFSFFPAKILGCFGDGGAVCTNSKRVADKIRDLRNHGDGGVNSRLDNLQAAVLNVKLKHLKTNLKRRKEIARMYDKGLKGLDIKLPKKREIYQDYPIQCQHRDELKDFLTEKGVETLVGKYDLLGTELELRLPLYIGLTDAEVKAVIATVKLFYEE